MRKLLIAALAATALVPGVATAQGHGHYRHEQQQLNRERRQVNNQRRVINNQRREVYNEQRVVNNERRAVNQNWRAYRQTHRQVFTRPAYVAPRGYSYRRVVVGYRLNPVFWGRSYRVYDYGNFGLPWPGRGRAYVRYGDDLLLINVYNGRVIRVYEDFFY